MLVPKKQNRYCSVIRRAVRNRHRKDKKYGYVIVPIFSEKFRDERISEAAKRSQYDTISDTLDALREQDNKLDLLLDEANRSFKRGKGYLTKVIRKLRDKIIFVDNEIPVKNFEKHIFLKVLETFRNNWDDMFGLLLKFKDRYKHCDVPLNSRGEFKELASWVHKIRLTRRRKLMMNLSDQNIQELNKIGFIWRIKGETVPFPNNFKIMKDIEREFGISSAAGNFWKKIQPKGKIYSGEAGKFLNLYDLDEKKVKNKLGVNYFEREVNLKSIISVDEILSILRKPRAINIYERDLTGNYFKNQGFKVKKYYSKSGKIVTYIDRSSFLNFYRRKNIKI